MNWIQNGTICETSYSFYICGLITYDQYMIKIVLQTVKNSPFSQYLFWPIHFHRDQDFPRPVASSVYKLSRTPTWAHHFLIFFSLQSSVYNPFWLSFTFGKLTWLSEKLSTASIKFFLSFFYFFIFVYVQSMEEKYASFFYI